MRLLLISLLLIFCSKINSQQYKIELTQGLVAMKDPVNGGYMNFFDWQKSYGTLIYNVSKNLITITEKAITTTYRVLAIDKKFQVEGCLTYMLDCTMTQDDLSYRYRVRLSIFDKSPTGNVFIADGDYVMLAYNGTEAVYKD